MTGFKIITDTFDRATKEIEKRARQNVRMYGEHVAREYKKDASQYAPWSDKRGVARHGIDGKVAGAGDRVTVTMGAKAPNYKHGPKSTSDYMEYLEFGHGGRFATVYPTVDAMKADIIANFGAAALTGSMIRIRRDKTTARLRAAKSRAAARARETAEKRRLKDATRQRKKVYKKSLKSGKRLYKKRQRRR